MNHQVCIWKLRCAFFFFFLFVRGDVTHLALGRIICNFCREMKPFTTHSLLTDLSLDELWLLNVHKAAWE